MQPVACDGDETRDRPTVVKASCIWKKRAASCSSCPASCGIWGVWAIVTAVPAAEQGLRGPARHHGNLDPPGPAASHAAPLGLTLCTQALSLIVFPSW